MHALQSTALYLKRLPMVFAICLTFQATCAEPSGDAIVFQETGKKRVHVEGCGRLTGDPAERATLARMTLAEAAAKGLALCSRWPDNHPAVTHGRIGLRHMFTRSARYKDFRVSEAVSEN